MRVNHYYPTRRATPPEPGEEAICGYIMTSNPEQAITGQLQTYCKVCLEVVRIDRNATMFSDSDI